MPRLRSWRAVSPRWRGLFSNISASPKIADIQRQGPIHGQPPQTYEGVGPEFAAAASRLDFRRVMNEMGLRIRPFEYQVIAARLLVLAMNKHPAMDRRNLPEIEQFKRQALV